MEVEMRSKSEVTPKIYTAKAVASLTTGQCDCGDCDCACADPVISSALTFAPLQRLKKAKKIFFSTLDEEHALVFNCDNPVQPALLNRSAHALLNSLDKPLSLSEVQSAYVDLPPSLVEQVCATFVSLKLVDPLDMPAIIPAALSAQTPLTAWLHLTDRCNLRCAYCYLPHAPLDMSLEVGRDAIQAVFRSALAHGYRKVKFKYAGGEPLLRFDVLLDLHRYALVYGSQLSLEVEGVVLSNGTLLDEEKARALKENGLRLMISLDGIQEDHNLHRFYANGKGSFAEVSHAIELACAQGLIPDISITVSNRNAAGLAALIKWVLDRDLPFSFNFFRGNDLAASNLQFEEDTIIQGMLAAFDVIEENLPRRSILPSLLDRTNLSVSHRHTCGVGLNYLAFSPDGAVAKCQMQLRASVATNHSEDPLALIQADKTGIQNLDVDLKDECSLCQWRYLCTGGCPLETHRVTGSYRAKISPLA
jgi:uncharacterized protein